MRSLSDFKGQELIARVLALMDQYQPLHLSIVGGDPLVRYRELDVLRLLQGSLSLGDIARELFLSTNTVKTHAHAIYRKLDAHSRDEAVRAARRNQLI